jgi:Xaa-Pro aminopeptidase
VQNSRGLSFTTIAAYGANGAIIHYVPAPETNAVIGRQVEKTVWKMRAGLNTVVPIVVF